MNNDFIPDNRHLSAAQSEEALFNASNYEEQQRLNELERKEEIKDELHFWIVRFIKLFLSAAALAGIIYFWHLITPTYLTWNNCLIMKLYFLSEKQLDKLSAFFVTVVLSSTFTGYAKKYIE